MASGLKVAFVGAGYMAEEHMRAFAGLPDVTIRVFPADNHLFFPGSGPSEPAEYEPAQHVDDAVIADVAQWIHQRVDVTREG